MCNEKELTIDDMCDKCKCIIRKYEYGWIFHEIEEKEKIRRKIDPHQKYRVIHKDDDGKINILFDSRMRTNILILIQKIHFTKVQKYLLRNNWTKIDTKREHIVLFYLENSNNERVAEILLPLSEDFVDYTKAIYDAILTISKVENRDIYQIIDYLLSDE